MAQTSVCAIECTLQIMSGNTVQYTSDKNDPIAIVVEGQLLQKFCRKVVDGHFLINLWISSHIQQLPRLSNHRMAHAHDLRLYENNETSKRRDTVTGAGMSTDGPTRLCRSSTCDRSRFKASRTSHGSHCDISATPRWPSVQRSALSALSHEEKFVFSLWFRTKRLHLRALIVPVG
jgi:hypothetical protein